MGCLDQTRAKVALVGSSEKRAEIVIRRFSSNADIIFMHADRLTAKRLRSVEYVVFTRFVSHDAFVAARGMPRCFCRGGLESLSRAIAEAVAALRPRDDRKEA